MTEGFVEQTVYQGYPAKNKNSANTVIEYSKRKRYTPQRDD